MQHFEWWWNAGDLEDKIKGKNHKKSNNQSYDRYQTSKTHPASTQLPEFVLGAFFLLSNSSAGIIGILQITGIYENAKSKKQSSI